MLYRLISAITTNRDVISLVNSDIPFEFEVGSLRDVIVIKLSEERFFDGTSIDFLRDAIKYMKETKAITDVPILVIPSGIDFFEIVEIKDE